MPVLPESPCESEGTVDAVIEPSVRIRVEEYMCLYVYVHGTLSMFAGTCRSAHMCPHVAASPLSTEGNVGLILPP